MGTICVSKPDGSWAQCVPLAKAPPTISCSSDCTKSPSTSQMYCMILHVIICNSNTRLVTSTTHAHSNMHHHLIHIDSMCQRERETQRNWGSRMAAENCRILTLNFVWNMFPAHLTSKLPRRSSRNSAWDGRMISAWQGSGPPISTVQILGASWLQLWGLQ